MGAVLTIPSGAPAYQVRLTHTWNDPFGTTDISEGLYVSLPTPLGTVFTITKAEGVFSKTATVGPFAAGAEFRVYTKGDAAQNNVGSGADVALVGDAGTIEWHYARPHDLTTVVEFIAVVAGWSIGVVE